MRRADHLTAVLKSGGFALHGYLGRWFKGRILNPVLHHRAVRSRSNPDWQFH